MAETDSPGGNRSLRRGMAVLRAFKPELLLLGNGELAERTGLARSTVSRLTRTLVEAGLLEHDGVNRAYRLAPAVLSLAHAMRLSSPILTAIGPIMRARAAEWRVNIGLAAADGDSMVYLESFRTSHCARFRTVVSRARVPTELTSLGRAHLWALPAPERDGALAAIARRHPRDWPRLSREIDRAFGELERTGFCAVRWQPRALAVAAPIQTPTIPLHAVNISIASDEPLAAGRDRLGPLLLDLKAHCLERLALRTDECSTWWNSGASSRQTPYKVFESNRPPEGESPCRLDVRSPPR